MSTDAAPRRLEAAARHEQLAGVALTVTAERGFAGLTLEEVAERAGITRAALYRYFPRGKVDLFLTAVVRAGEQLTDSLIIDDDALLDDLFTRNLSRYIEHAMEPSDAWLVSRQAHDSGLQEAEEIDRRYRAIIISAMSRNHFGTPDPPPYGRLALNSFLEFAGAALDECRVKRLDRDKVIGLLAQALFAAVGASRPLDGARETDA